MADEQVFETRDMEVTEHLLHHVYGSMRLSASSERHGLRLAQTDLTSAVRLDHTSFAMHLEVSDANPLGVLLFGELKSGLVRYGSDGSERYYRPGQVYLAAQPDHYYNGTIDDTEVELAVLDPALPAHLASTAPSRAGQPLRFTGYEPVSPEAAQRWRTTYAYVRDDILGNPAAAAHPLLRSSAAQLLASVALSVFPNNALAEPTMEDRHDAHTATVRRAVEFIDANAHLDITVTDIAAACFVTTRAVQFAFQRHMETTPTDYLRRVRLDHAHRNLLAADPGHETVTAVAYRWGFHSSSRFTAYYRRAYGVTPSHTLRS
jgi:AraC-like DNA-binding protein